MPPRSYFSCEPDDRNTIEVKKGSPANAAYAVFYKTKKDPLIFCKNWAALKEELRKLKSKNGVNQKSIRVFKRIEM